MFYNSMGEGIRLYSHRHLPCFKTMQWLCWWVSAECAGETQNTIQEVWLEGQTKHSTMIVLL